MTQKRVVITGLGAITPLGSSIKAFWEGMLAGKSGIRRITQFDASGLPCAIAGEVPDFDPLAFLDRKEARRMSRSAQMALVATMQAIKDAGLPDTMPDPERAGVYLGTTVGGLERVADGIEVLRSKGFTRVNPYTLPSGIPNLAAFLVARYFKVFGPTFTISTACASSTQSIGEAAELIRRGCADIVVTGGVESIIRDFTIAGFIAMRALPVNYNDRPEAASRPFNIDREGFVFSEGAGILIVESLEHAKARNARIYAEVAGHSSSADGYHMAAPDPDAAGPIRAIRWALSNSNVHPNEVGYINAHGSSTPLNDIMETIAIKAVFGENAYNIPISSTKSMIGHPMGASGAMEAIASTLAIHTGTLPPTINYENPDPECDLDYIPNHARKQQVEVAISNSLGLGGQNACLVLKRFSANAEPNRNAARNT